MKDLVKAGYNLVADKYAAQRATEVFQHRRYLDLLVRLLPSSGTILDLGCGAGLPVDKYFDERGFKIIGLDFAEKQLELARRNVPRGEFELRDIADLREGEYQVNAVVAFYALFHLPRETHERMIRVINSFLPLGGLILVTMGASEWEGTEENFYGSKMWWSHYGPAKNRQMVEANGFEIILDEIDESGGEKHQIILARKL